MHSSELKSMRTDVDLSSEEVISVNEVIDSTLVAQTEALKFFDKVVNNNKAVVA